MTRPKASTSSKGKSPAKSKTGANRTVTEMFQQQRVLRKRPIVASDNESSSSDEQEDDQLVSSEDSESSDSEFETNSSKRQRTSKTSEKRSSKTSGSQRRKKSVTEVSLTHASQLLEPLAADGREGLYDQLSKEDVDIDEITTEWIDSYRADKEDALRNLINFFIRSCGCMTAVTEDAFGKEDIATEVLQELQSELAKLPQPEYPIISKSKSGKTFKRNILLFFKTFMEQCQHDIVYDGTFTETLHNWLATMASSTYRPFRHTATILTFRVLDCLAIFADKVTNELEVVQRQLRNESTRSGRARNAEKKRLMTQRATTLERKQEELNEFIDDFFESVFVHRARDVEHVIRSECIKELCTWSLHYSSHFVDNSYLRYIGWALNDQHARVRSEAVKSIIRMYHVESIVEKLKTFILRFKARIQEMALYDIDVSVRLQAIELCHLLFKHQPDLFDNDSRDLMMGILFVDNDRIQKAVAPFVKTVVEVQLYAPDLEKMQEDMQSMSVNDSSNNAGQSAGAHKAWSSYKWLASLLVSHINTIRANDNTMDTESSEAIATDIHHIVTTVVDALWVHLPVLNDYKAMADYLSRDHSSNQQDDNSMDADGVDEEYRLTDREEDVFISVFVASLHLITGRGVDKASTRGKDKKKQLDETELNENRAAVSRYLVPLLSRLLTKHNDNANKLEKLVTIPQLMNLDAYSDLRMHPAYEELVQTLIRVYTGATLPTLLENCAKTFHHMKAATFLSDVNDKLMPELIDSVGAQVRDACRGKDITICGLTNDDVHAITVSLLRLDHLISFIDVTDVMDESEDMNDDIVDLMTHFIVRAGAGFQNEKQISISAMGVLFRYFSWKCERISNDRDLTGAGRAAANKVERKRDSVMDKMTDLATAPDLKPLPVVRSTAFGIVMDLYWIFSSDLFSGSTELNLLRADCPDHTQERCRKYIASELENWQNAMNEDQSENETQDEDDESEHITKENHSEQGLRLVANVARAVSARVLAYDQMTDILAQYGYLGDEADSIMKAFIEELRMDLVHNEECASSICRSFLESLKKSFEVHVNDSYRSIDKTLTLARSQARTLSLADQEDPSRHVAEHVICDRLHIDGVTYVLSKAAENHKNKTVSLKFFRVLSILVKPLSRARDVAKIHKHIETLLAEHKLEPKRGDKEWEAYFGYVKEIDQILKRKGLRYAN